MHTSRIGVLGILAFGFSFSLVSAHVIVTPKTVGVAEEQEFAVGVANERDTAVTALRLLMPAGLEEVAPTVKPGWTIEVKKDGETLTEIDWTGGSIPPGQRDDFGFSAQVPATAQTLAWKAYQTYQDGTVVSWDQPPTTSKDQEDRTPYSQTEVVNDLASTSPAPKDTVARTLAAAGLVLAAAAVAVAVRRR